MPGLKFVLTDEESGEKFEFLYPNGIVDYVREISGESGFTMPQYYETQTKGRDRADKDEYKVKMQFAFCFNNYENLLEYYHNSSFLENGDHRKKR